MNEVETSHVFEAAARALINERCAPAFLHDVRGTMQALFSAVELLGRSAMADGANSSRAQRVCDLARRALDHHEKSTVQVLEILALQTTAVQQVDVGNLLHEVIHFLRNDAAGKNVSLTAAGEADVRMLAERGKLWTLLVGLVTAGMDETEPGQNLHSSLERIAENAVISIGPGPVNHGAPIQRAEDGAAGSTSTPASGDLHYRRELTLRFARSYLAAQNGRLEIEPTTSGTYGRATLRLIVPLAG